MPKALPPKTISLALQGGGSHAAFTWGVVDQILQDERMTIKAISASSGGAMLAVAMAQGMMEGGRAGAHAALTAFFKKVSVAASMMPMRMNIVDKFLSNVGVDTSSLALDYITRIFSPSQFNLFDINPLRGIVEEMIDFKALNKKSPIALYINATHARTGKSTIFTEKELSLDAVMASSCLPFVFKTVEVDGEPYWDGSFSGCPPLLPLAEAGSKDIVLVQVHPSPVEDVPITATDILDRALEMSFNAVLDQEIKLLEQQKSAPRLHRIEANDMLTSVGRASKLNAEWDFLLYLHDLGTQAAQDWLKKPSAAA